MTRKIKIYVDIDSALGKRLAAYTQYISSLYRWSSSKGDYKKKSTNATFNKWLNDRFFITRLQNTCSMRELGGLDTFWNNINMKDIVELVRSQFRSGCVIFNTNNFGINIKGIRHIKKIHRYWGTNDVLTYAIDCNQPR